MKCKPTVRDDMYQIYKNEPIGKQGNLQFQAADIHNSHVHGQLHQKRKKERQKLTGYGPEILEGLPLRYHSQEVTFDGRRRAHTNHLQTLSQHVPDRMKQGVTLLILILAEFTQRRLLKTKTKWCEKRSIPFDTFDTHLQRSDTRIRHKEGPENCYRLSNDQFNLAKHREKRSYPSNAGDVIVLEDV